MVGGSIAVFSLVHFSVCALDLVSIEPILVLWPTYLEGEKLARDLIFEPPNKFSGFVEIVILNPFLN